MTRGECRSRRRIGRIQRLELPPAPSMLSQCGCGRIETPSFSESGSASFKRVRFQLRWNTTPVPMRALRLPGWSRTWLPSLRCCWRALHVRPAEVDRSAARAEAPSITLAMIRRAKGRAGGRLRAGRARALRECSQRERPASSVSTRKRRPVALGIDALFRNTSCTSCDPGRDIELHGIFGWPCHCKTAGAFGSQAQIIHILGEDADLRPAHCRAALGSMKSGRRSPSAMRSSSAE